MADMKLSPSQSALGDAVISSLSNLMNIGLLSPRSVWMHVHLRTADDVLHLPESGRLLYCVQRFT
jgi:hypothetical protein